MHSLDRKKQAPNATYILSIILLMTGMIHASFATPKDPHHKVASVNGTPIFYADIQADASELPRWPAQTDKKVLSLQNRLEKDNLTAKIREIILRQKLQQFNVVIDNEQFQKAWTEFADQQKLKESAKKIQEDFSTVYKALSAVYDDGKNPDRVYQQFFKDGQLSRTEWKLWLDKYKSSQSRNTMKTSFHQIADQVLQPAKDSFEKRWKQKLLFEQVDHTLAKNDPIFAYFKKLLPNYYSMWDLNNIPLSGDEIDAELYLPFIRWTWQNEQYRKTEIVIYDKAYKDVTNSLAQQFSPQTNTAIQKTREKYIALTDEDPNYDLNTYFKMPSKMPVLDTKEVKHLIETIDKPHHAAILKKGYFAADIDHPYKISEFLLDAIRKTSKGSLRWFALLSTEGYADFNMRTIFYGKEWSYNEIFDNLIFARTPIRRAVVLQSIRDIVTSIAKTTSMENLFDKDKLSDLLVRAWKTNQHLQKMNLQMPKQTPLDWEDAFKGIHAESKFRELMNKAGAED